MARLSRIAQERGMVDRMVKEQRRAAWIFGIIIAAIVCIYLPFVALGVWVAHLLIGWTAAIIGVSVLALGFAAFAVAVLKIVKLNG